MKFTFSPGAKPLSGYTIKRAIHRGGFGEVYYAVSDAGKEVALKLLQQNQETELRGVQQCLNLKHANLVTIFDVVKDKDGDFWIVMEFVAGRTLQQIIAQHPRGLPLSEIDHWLNGITKGLAFLHQKGIVHRDLKPGNVFQDVDGTIQIGDVGLSKLITESRRHGQTASVGTVYYMAPEIAHGSYAQEIDIYSLGIILYEMLTGEVPFDGETTAEILLKHLTNAPDLSRLPTPLQTLLGSMLEKDPAQRLKDPHIVFERWRSALQHIEPDWKAPEEHSSHRSSPQDLSWNQETTLLPGHPVEQTIDPSDQTVPLLPAERLNEIELDEVTLPYEAELNKARSSNSAAATTTTKPQVSLPQPEADQPHETFWSFQNIVALLSLIVILPALLKFVPVNVTLFNLAIAAILFLIITKVFQRVTWIEDLYDRYIPWATRTSEVNPPRHAQTETEPSNPLLDTESSAQSSSQDEKSTSNWKRDDRKKVRSISHHYQQGYPVLDDDTDRELDWRTKLMELTGSLVLGLFCAAIITGMLSLFTYIGQSYEVMSVFFGSTLFASWGLLILSKLQEGTRMGFVKRRISYLILGALVGLLIWNLQSWVMFEFPADPIDDSVGGFHSIAGHTLMSSKYQPTMLGTAIFFSLLFVARRWWRHAHSLREDRFRVTSVLMTCFVAFMILCCFAFPFTWGMLLATSLSMTVQISSMWVPFTERVQLMKGASHGLVHSRHQ